MPRGRPRRVAVVKGYSVERVLGQELVDGAEGDNGPSARVGVRQYPATTVRKVCQSRTLRLITRRSGSIVLARPAPARRMQT